MKLRTRLFIAMGAVVATTVVLVSWTVSASARRAFEAIDAERTAAFMAQFRREFARERQEVVRRVDRIATSEEFRRSAMELGAGLSRARYVNAAEPLASAQGLDFLDIIAEDGIVISSAHWPARFGYRTEWAGGALQSSDAFLDAISTPAGTALGIVAIRTTASGSGRMYVAGGTWLDSEFLSSLTLPAAMRAMLYRNISAALSGQQLIGASGGVAQLSELAPLIARVRDTGRESSQTVHSPNGREVVHGIPLIGRDRVVVGVVLVGSSERELDALIERIWWTGLGTAIVGIVIGGAFSWLLASRVTRPVEQLAAGARAIASGDWSSEIDVRATGEVAELAHAFSDMTHQLVDQRERLVQAERVASWRELARRLAHELKNPLFPLRLTVDNLERAKAEHPQQFDEVFDEGIGTLRTGLSNLTGVISRFSDFARLPSPVVDEVAVNDVARQVSRLFQAQLQTAGPPIGLTLDLSEDVGVIRADAEQLGRALQNLLLNAIDAMPAGGSVTIRTRRGRDTVTIDVSDTGEGLMPEERERLFTPYYTTKQHGTGLGLAIVQSVAADHGGRVRVESRPGLGTTFHIELPVAGPRPVAS